MRRGPKAILAVRRGPRESPGQRVRRAIPVATGATGQRVPRYQRCRRPTGNPRPHGKHGSPPTRRRPGRPAQPACKGPPGSPGGTTGSTGATGSPGPTGVTGSPGRTRGPGIGQKQEPPALGNPTGTASAAQTQLEKEVPRARRAFGEPPAGRRPAGRDGCWRYGSHQHPRRRTTGPTGAVGATGATGIGATGRQEPRADRSCGSDRSARRDGGYRHGRHRTSGPARTTRNSDNWQRSSRSHRAKTKSSLLTCL